MNKQTQILSTAIVELDTDDIYIRLIASGVDQIRAAAFIDSMSQAQLEALAQHMNDTIFTDGVFSDLLDDALYNAGHLNQLVTKR